MKLLPLFLSLVMEEHDNLSLTKPESYLYRQMLLGELEVRAYSLTEFNQKLNSKQFVYIKKNYHEGFFVKRINP